MKKEEFRKVIERDFGKKEFQKLMKLNKEKKVQNFLNELEINFEYKGDTCMSPFRVLQEKKAHCIEGAMLAALILRLHGEKSLVVDLTATEKDFDHVICVFNKYGKWGCISKSNHAAHRYREPIYRDIRELVMSIFHEYIDKEGRKTLRSFSQPVDLEKFDYLQWWKVEHDLWEIPEYLAEVKHENILNRKQIANLRKADKIEIDVGNVVEWKEEKR